MDCSTPGVLSISISRSLLKLMSIESVMPCSHLTLCCPLLLLASILTSIRVSSNESALRIRWPGYRTCSFSISPCNEACCQDGIWKFRPLGVSSAPRKPRAGAHACSVASSSLGPTPPRWAGPRRAPLAVVGVPGGHTGAWGHFFLQESWTAQRETDSGAGQRGCGALGRQRTQRCEPGRRGPGTAHPGDPGVTR